MKISVIIPNYNGLNLLKKNLPRLIAVLEKDKITAEIIIVDDASNDSSIEWLDAFIKVKSYKGITFTLVKHETNQGFSSTSNTGAKSATSDFLVFLNTDIYPKKGFITESLKHFEDERVFAVGLMDESIEDGKIVLRGSGDGKWQKGFYLHKEGNVGSNTTDWISGGSGIFRKKVFDKLGGFDPIYNPFYWEDIDLSYRAKRKGYTLVFEPKSVVVHEHGKGAILSKYSKQDIRRISYRNQFIFVFNNASPLQLFSHIFWLPYHLTLSLFGDQELFVGFFAAITRFTQFKLFKS